MGIVRFAKEIAGVGPAWEYWIDACQRAVLFLDTLRERGNIAAEHAKQQAPNVLEFPYEVVRDGRTLARPVNYGLVRIVPPAGATVDPSKAPIIVVDPRAGHGPGIGGMKPESEIGVAISAGHPCYFVGFSPEPMPGQTIEDVCCAEAVFIEDVARRQSEVERKPIVIANCQAGWQTMMTAAIRPDLMGPIILAGSPLCYWAGVRGKNPMRYLGGVLGGAWLTALAGDLGHGNFDGANLVANFEQANPANTYWTKPYNVYSKVDTERERFLEFETWWGSPVLLNAGEMQWIVDNLFVGDKLSTGQIRTSDRIRIDLRNIKSPIVVFCSWGDNITPPQQALDWILDLYDNVDEIISNDQTIIYSLHHTIGHLGLFVSGKVAEKEDREFVSCIEMIDAMPPGLYEATITDVGEDTENRELLDGKYLFRLEARTLDDIRAFGVNSAEDEKRFAAVARISEINLGLYRTFAQPWVRAFTTESSAEALRALHPHRVRFSIFSDENPLIRPVKAMAAKARANRKPVSADNPFLAWEKSASDWITNSLRSWGDIRDAMTEAAFLNTYGSPLPQAIVGLNAEPKAVPRHIERELERESARAELRSSLENRFEAGGAEEGALRALLYIRRPDGAADERAFRLAKAIRDSKKANERLTLAQFKDMLREQFQLLRMDEERAVKALPKLIHPGERDADAALDALRRLIAAPGPLSKESKARAARVENLVGVKLVETPATTTASTLAST
jgi:pimeloyl-ACP methyl ester carboxylesterase